MEAFFDKPTTRKHNERAKTRVQYKKEYYWRVDLIYSRVKTPANKYMAGFKGMQAHFYENIKKPRRRQVSRELYGKGSDLATDLHRKLFVLRSSIANHKDFPLHNYSGIVTEMNPCFRLKINALLGAA